MLAPTSADFVAVASPIDVVLRSQTPPLRVRHVVSLSCDNAGFVAFREGVDAMLAIGAQAGTPGLASSLPVPL